MNTILYPSREKWAEILQRPAVNPFELEETCKTICEEIIKHGDDILRKYTWYFDRVKLDDIEEPEEEIQESASLVDPDLQQAIRNAKKNIEAFHRLQLSAPKTYVNENGFRCWQEERPIEKVGLYIPGGNAPLFSTVLMLCIPANIAGCKEIFLCTPPGKDGKINPAILWTARLCGVTRIFKVGGIQAIGALAIGTETIPKVDKIFGPGNHFVTAAKQWVTRYRTAIDMPAGPSEIMIVSDDSATPAYIAADLLSQAEHGPDSQAILVTNREDIAIRVKQETERQLGELPQGSMAFKAQEHIRLIVLNDLEECIEMVNQYAPEHLILNIRDYLSFTKKVQHAGSVFLGNYSPESAGDYASGTNHTLPTNGYARSYSGITVDAFRKKISFQEIFREGLSYLGNTIETMAANELLEAHRKAVSIRLKEEPLK